MNLVAYVVSQVKYDTKRGKEGAKIPLIFK